MSDLYGELLALVGKEVHPINGVDAVCKQMIRHYCEAMEDANPLYTDEEYARKSKYGSIVAPPVLTPAFSQIPLWPNGQEMQYRHPEKLSREEAPEPSEATMEKLEKAGFTGMFATAISQEFIHPLFPGDKVTRTVKIVSVTPEKKTRVGNGHFLKLVYSYTNQRGELICKATYDILRFKPLESTAEQ